MLARIVNGVINCKCGVGLMVSNSGLGSGPLDQGVDRWIKE